ncbi:asparagine synthetase B, partial [bacterium]|nr:asparagine synthetase B [bacterium]
MNGKGMARIRGYATLGNFHPGSRFLDHHNPQGGCRHSFLPARFPRALLASTDRQTLAARRIGRSRLGVAGDGFVVSKQHGLSASRVLDSYVQFGFPKCAETWLGDFAISLYEESSHTLFLVRDRIGVRPLYYVANRHWIAFSSQPLALTSLPGVGREPNPVFLGLYAGCHYRTFDNDPHASPYRHVCQLPAGHWLRWCAGTLEIQRYWHLSDLVDFPDSEEGLARRYRQTLFQAVRSRLGQAKKPGFLLSGGMDSSSVLSAAVRLTGRKQRAYSSTYADSTYDESGEIRTILDSMVSHWSNVRVGEKNIFQTIQQMVRTHEEPVATATWLSHFEVSRHAARDGIGCLFTGLGGDELNAGEYEHFIFFFADLHRMGKRAALRREIRAWQRHHNHPIYRKNRSIALGLIHDRTDPEIPGSVFPDVKLFFRYRRCLNPERFDLSLFRPVLDRLFQDSLKNRCYQDIFRETAPCCLRAQDRHGWAFG